MTLSTTLLRRGVIYPLLVCAALLVAGVASAAWSGPCGASPSACNASGPLDQSATAQTKLGGLVIGTAGVTNGLVVSTGNVGIGANPSFKLDIQANVASWSTRIYNNNANASGLYIHNGNDNNFSLGILNAAGNAWGAYFYGNGDGVVSRNFTASGQVTTPIVYDANNAGYYTDPASISSMYRIDVDHLYDRNNYTYYIDPNVWSRMNAINADAMLVGGSWVCREDGTNCPAGATGHRMGGMYTWNFTTGCTFVNPWTGGCSCPSWAPNARTAHQSTIGGQVNQLSYCTN